VTLRASAAAGIGTPRYPGSSDPLSGIFRSASDPAQYRRGILGPTWPTRSRPGGSSVVPRSWRGCTEGITDTLTERLVATQRADTALLGDLESLTAEFVRRQHHARPEAILGPLRLTCGICSSLKARALLPTCARDWSE
jgi:hypothetical protein